MIEAADKKMKDSVLEYNEAKQVKSEPKGEPKPFAPVPSQADRAHAGPTSNDIYKYLSTVPDAVPDAAAT